jgi:hypothetical protein
VTPVGFECFVNTGVTLQDGVSEIAARGNTMVAVEFELRLRIIWPSDAGCHWETEPLKKASFVCRIEASSHVDITERVLVSTRR